MKAYLKNLSPNNLPLDYWFETERAHYFPTRQIVRPYPDEQEFPIQGIHMTKGEKNVWAKRLHADQQGKKDIFIEITKDEALLWLIEQSYLTMEEELDRLLEVYTPTDPIPPSRKWSNPTRKK